ncbi:MAG: hypothetical protein ACLQCU_01110 [Acidimicrobiales bacterium]
MANSSVPDRGSIATPFSLSWATWVAQVSAALRVANDFVTTRPSIRVRML